MNQLLGFKIVPSSPVSWNLQFSRSKNAFRIHCRAPAQSRNLPLTGVGGIQVLRVTAAGVSHFVIVSAGRLPKEDH